MWASTPQKTTSQPQVKWTRGKCRKKERVTAPYRPRGKSKFWVGSKGSPEYTDSQELRKSLGKNWAAALLRSVPCLPGVKSSCSRCCHHLACWSHQIESQLSCAAGRSSVSSVGPWEQTAFVAFWEEPQDPARSGYCKTTLEALLVMGSHQGKERLCWRGLYLAVMVVWVVFLWIKEVLMVRSLMRSEVPPYRAGKIFVAWMHTEREALGQEGRRGFLIFFCESSFSLREPKACFRGRPGLASHQHFNDCRHNHSGRSFYSRNYRVPHNTGLPASSCATSCSWNGRNQSHPPPPPPPQQKKKKEKKH